MPSNGGHTSPVATSTTQSVYIRVAQVNVLPIPDPATNPPLTPTSGHLYLIEGTIDAIGRYAGATVDWLVKVAHLICDPRGGGRLYTHPGDSSDWYDLDRTPSWHEVVQGDPLLPAIYEFVPTAPIFLSKISRRHMHSATTEGSQSSAATFREEIGQREGGRCPVTRAPAPLTGSHLIPKRMGSDGARDVVARFCGETAALGIHRFHPKLGILLFYTLDPLVDNFALGFYHVTGDTYLLHNFDTVPDRTLIGTPPGCFPGDHLTPPLHLFSVTLSVHNPNISLPPVGVFDWHYLQCVIRMFGTKEYNDVLNIVFHALPFKTGDDSDDDSGDDSVSDNGGLEPPYPSYPLDRLLEEQWKRQKEIEHRKEVVRWSAGVPSGI